jgi:transposase InsO family protein
VNLFHCLLKHSRYLHRYQLIKESYYSRSQFYTWLNAGIDGIAERKTRECKPVSEDVVRNAVEVIRDYPHFGARKGTCYMIYHQSGYIPQHLYKSIKKIVKRLIFQEVSRRHLLPARTSYRHERAQAAGEIWAEDFSQIRVCGELFYFGLVIDVAISYYAGSAVSTQPNDQMVQIPVEQALELNNGHGPKRFLLSDNGPQYVKTLHGDFLEKLGIIQKRIPSCHPEYNGSVECGIKEFKNVFYNVWADMETENRKKSEGEGVKVEEESLLERVQLAVAETNRKMNDEIPRPSLKGVTSADAWKGIALERREINRTYLEKEREKKEVMKPWNRKDWSVIKERLFKGDVSNLELLTKFCFFLKRPLRKLANLGCEVLGN